MKLVAFACRSAVGLALWLCLPLSLSAVTLDGLRHEARLTPERLIRSFADFKFKQFDDLQPREAFLCTQVGDCYDFATLAADILREKGYTTRLVAVHMEQQAHVVCYVAETGCYLDYNNRKSPSPLVSTDGSLADIAGKVARSFRASWFCASEFSFKNGQIHSLRSDFRPM